MKIRIKFSKHGAMKFIGHLDVMRYFQKAMRRAEKLIRYSEGFSPHQIMSFASPLGVGLVSNGEYMDIEVLSTGTSEEMVNRLNDVMVDGIKVLSWKKLPDNAVNAMSLVAACDYTVRLKEEYENGLGLSAAELFDRLSVFLQCDSLEITKKTKKGEKQMDIRPWIYEARPLAGEDGFFLQVSSGSTVNVKPEQVLEAFYRSEGMEYPAFAFQITREEVYADLGTDQQTDRKLQPLEAFGTEIDAATQKGEAVE